MTSHMLSSSFCRQAHKILVTSCTNPYVNLAKEASLLYASPSPDRTLYLWRNSPVAVIGKFQNPYKECDLQYMKKNDIFLTRRPTGGGAVYQDLGNTCWTFIDPEFRPQYNTKVICDALAKLNIKANGTGRNDVEVDGKKVSGAAFRKTPHRSIHHGTMLMNVDLKQMARVLTVNVAKLQAKGVDSVRSRVMNLTEIDPTINHDRFCSAIIDAYQIENGKCEIEHVTQEDMLKEPEVRRVYEELSSHEWLYGKSSEAKVTSSNRFVFGLFEIVLHFSKGRIESCDVFSDCLVADLVTSFTDAINKSIKDLSNAQRIFNDFNDSWKNSDYHTMATNLSVWIMTEIKKWY